DVADGGAGGLLVDAVVAIEPGAWIEPAEAEELPEGPTGVRHGVEDAVDDPAVAPFDVLSRAAGRAVRVTRGAGSFVEDRPRSVLHGLREREIGFRLGELRRVRARQGVAD